MGRWLRLSFLILTLAALTSSIAESIGVEERFQFADGLYARGMYELAAKEYEAFLRDFPDSGKADVACFRLGESYRHTGDFSAAEKQFRKVFLEYKDSKFRLRAGFRRADLFMKIEQYGAAIDLFRMVLKEKLPEDMGAASLYLMGEALMKTGKKDEAAETFGKVKSQYPSSKFLSFTLLRLGEIALEKQDGLDKAIEYFKAASEKPASDRVAAEALFQIAELHFRKSAFDKSSAAYKKLLDEYPSDSRSSEARLRAAWAAHHAGLYTDALKIAVSSLKGSAADRTAEWMYLKANCERRLMKNAEAVKTYAQLLAAHPDSKFAGPVRHEKALIHYKLGQFDEAVSEACRIKLTGENKKDIYWLLAESYSSAKREDGAVQYYSLLAKEFPKSDVSCDATYRLAHHLQSRGQLKEASRLYNQVAANFPKSEIAARALFASAACLARENMHAEATRDWTRVVREYPSDLLVEESYYQKAMGETRLRRDEDALNSLRALLKKFPQSKFKAEAHYWQGMLLKEAGKLQDAEEQFRAALKSGVRKEIARKVEFHLAIVLQKAGKFDESVSFFQPLLSSPLREKFSPALLEWLCEYRLGRKDLPEAVQAARALIELNDEPGWRQIGWCLLGRGVLAQGNNDAAKTAFEKSLGAKAATRFASEAALRLGEIAAGANKFADSEGYFKQAAGLASDDAQLGVRVRAYAGLARCAKATKDLANAARYFMIVSILYDDPELVPECLYEAAEALRAQGKEKEAAKVIEELKKRYPASKWTRKTGQASVSGTGKVGT